MDDQSFKYSIKYKFLTIIIFIIIFVSSILALFFVSKTKNELITEAEKRGASEVANLAHDAQYGILTEDTVILDYLIAGRMKKPDIAYIIITLEDGKVLADSIKDKYALMNVHKGSDNQLSINQVIDSSQLVTRRKLISKDGEEIYEFTAKVKTSGEEDITEYMKEEILLLSDNLTGITSKPLIRGFVKMGISLDPINKKVMHTLFFSVAIIFTLTILTLVISYYLTGLVVNPIINVANAAREIAKGNLLTEVKISSRDEVGILARNFNMMSVALNKTIKELEQLKKGLERKVQKRTTDLKEANLRLEKANKELMTLDQMKNEFIFMVSHDFRTPLASIVGFAKSMSDSIKDEIINRLDLLELSKENNKRFHDEIIETQKFINIIVNEGERLTRLINHMLDLSRIEANKMEWNNEYISFIDTVDFALNSISFLANDKGIKMTVETDAFIPKVFCDQDRLIQALVNLLGNAIKFTNYGGAIKCSIRNKKTEIECKIIDSGIGISKNNLPTIFNKFKQVSSTHENIPKGTGLGLPICREIISHYGGRIWVDSELGKGSTFTFTLPIAVRD